MATIRAELLSAYVLTASRVGAWAVVSGIVSRWGGMKDFGELSVSRGAGTLLTYVTVGMSPVLIRALVRAAAVKREAVAERVGNVLEYEPVSREGPSQEGIAGTATLVALVCGIVMGAVALWTLGLRPEETGRSWVGMAMVGGMLVRVLSDVSGAVLQSRGQLRWDNYVMAAGEWLWPAFTVAFVLMNASGGNAAATAFLVSGLIVGGLRGVLANTEFEPSLGNYFDFRVLGLLLPAAVIVVSSLADYCYGPLNQVLLRRLSSAEAVAGYAPSLQIDSALLLLTAAISAVVLPRATAALAKGEISEVRHVYARGTLGSIGVLGVAAAVIGVFATPLLRVWLGAATAEQASWVVPWVLIHTVIGGSSGVGRAMILAAGRYRTYAGVAVGFGVANAVGVWAVLSQTSWGVKGVVGVTIVTVVLRCGVWMPWYVMKLLGTSRKFPEPEVVATPHPASTPASPGGRG